MINRGGENYKILFYNFRRLSPRQCVCMKKSYNVVKHVMTSCDDVATVQNVEKRLVKKVTFLIRRFVHILHRGGHF